MEKHHPTLRKCIAEGESWQFFLIGNAFEPRVTIGNRMQQVTHILSLVK